MSNDYNLINFEKRGETEYNNKLIQQYNVNFFHSEWFTYDFLIYASKCYKRYTINFFDQENKLYINDQLKESFEIETNFIQNLCTKNKLNFSITLFSNEKGFTLTKLYGRDIITCVTNLDETFIDINLNMKQLKYNYSVYIQSEHVFNIIKSYNQKLKPSEITLLSGYMLINHMLSLKDDEFTKFYNTNIKWIEKSFSFVNSDKKYWNELFNSIKKDLNIE